MISSSLVPTFLMRHILNSISIITSDRRSKIVRIVRSVLMMLVIVHLLMHVLLLLLLLLMD